MQPLDAGEPRAVGPYRLLGRLGAGGMGRVYLGRSTGGRTVAVKIVHPHFALDEQFRARFRREVAAARRVGGAWTAPVLDADPEAAVPWVATGYVAGPSLAQALTPDPPADPDSPLPPRPLPEHSVRALGAGLAEALAHVHALGLVHRDVKPSNVLLAMDGPRLIDFGIARASDGTASLTTTGVSIGSPGYMAPEQILGGAVTGAADVFSLGAVLAYAATGRPPFPGDSSAALLYRVVHEEPVLDGLGGPLLDLVCRCLTKDPAPRPAPAELARRLAPEGAARAVAAGWLPAPLVEQVGRDAVRLLDLEAAEVPPGGALSGPVPFDRPAVTADPGTGTVAPPATGPAVPHPGGPVASGTFGPPDPSYRPTEATPPPGSPAHPPTAPGQAPVPGPRSGEEADGKQPGKFSLRLSAGSGTGSNGRGRQVSCTLALAVAGALAAVTLGGAFLLDVLPGSGNGDGPAAGADHSPVASAPARDSATAVPKAYLGHWKGEAQSSRGLPVGTFALEVHQARKGARFATLVTDLYGSRCKDVLTLDKADGGRITATGRGDSGNGPLCSQAAHTVFLKPVGDDLRYTSVDPKAGNPSARLSRDD
ncbi:protein kinase [Streptomyces sp. NPDC058045]|uniref:serine/threonine-protein kinase n=1 Tax=Streptomyces sp. NPDC058045 TaxID=3346311 RepID=UPI0036EB3C14